MNWLDRLMGRGKAMDDMDRLYVAVAELARNPVLFTLGGVPDSIDGRFDALLLTLAIMVQRLGDEPDTDPAIRLHWQKQLMECFVRDMDMTLRELGTGDMSVGRKVRETAAAMSGRMVSYGDALRADPESAGDALRDALVRNLYRSTAPQAQALDCVVHWVRQQQGRFADQPIAALHAGALAGQPSTDAAADMREAV